MLSKPITTNVLLLIVIALLLVVGYMQFLSSAGLHKLDSENCYFAAAQDGQLFSVEPINRQVVTQAALSGWVSEAVVDTMTFGFHDYEMRFDDNSRYFTSKGWESFLAMLKNSRFIELISANQQVVNVNVKGVPVILSKGVVEGRYQWKLEVPIDVAYQFGSEKRSDSLLLTLTVVRSLRSVNGKEIAIDSWVSAVR